MAGLTLPCPKCTAPLKLKDRSLLGKMAKCPRCGHKFVLQEEQEIELELVESTEPAEGRNATWIPDQPTTAKAASQKKSQPAATPGRSAAASENPLAGLFQESNTPAPGGATADNPLSFLQSDTPAPPTGGNPLFSSQDEASPAATAASLNVAAGKTSESSSSVPRRRRKRRRSQGGLLWAGLATGLLLLVAGGVYYQSTTSGPLLEIAADTPAGTATPAADPTATPGESVASSGTSGRGTAAPASYNPVRAKSPTSGAPIQLLHMPAGVRVAINLHPARIWSNDQKYAEFRASMGPLGVWLEQRIEELTKQPPANIEELLIGIILGAKGTEPEIAAVVRFKEPQQRADLLRIYSGTPYQEFSTDIKLDNGYAYRIVNDSLVAICPELYVDDLQAFEKSSAMTADHLQEILKATDRDRLITVVFDPDDIELHKEALFPTSAEMVVEKSLRWLGEDVWAAAWSLHLEDDFHTELLVRGQNHVGPQALKQRYQQRLDVLPEMLLTAVQKMNPQRSGYRRIIGRFPAMTKVLAMASASAVDGRFVRLGALLPTKAGPNLALGTLLTWDESTRTDFSAKKTEVAQTPRPAVLDRSKLPFQERLKLKINAHFNNTALQDIMDFIADEVKIPIDIDGDALKSAGFTKNMNQTIEMENATPLQVIYGILKRYEEEADPMVIHIDEKNNRILLLTKKVAEERKLSTYDFKANGFK